MKKDDYTITATVDGETTKPITMEQLENNLQAHINGGNQIQITKSKVKYNCLEVEYKESGDIIARQSSKQVHPDLIAAYAKLVPHLIILCDMRELIEGEKPEDYNPDATQKITVTSFSIGGSDEHEGVTLTGQKRIGKKVLNLNSPFTKWDDEFDLYEYSYELHAAINACVHEIIQYLNGKFAPDPQLELELNKTVEN